MIDQAEDDKEMGETDLVQKQARIDLLETQLEEKELQIVEMTQKQKQLESRAKSLEDSN